MIYLNFSDLSEETKARLIKNSRKDVKQKFGPAIRRYSKEYTINFETMLEEETMRNLHSYTYVFNI